MTRLNSNNNHSSLCTCSEVGDLSGKFGVSYSKISSGGSWIFSSGGAQVDYYPPWIANYASTIKNSPPWTSVVFHCAATDARLLCGKLSTTDVSACAEGFASFSQSASSPSAAPSTSSGLVSAFPTASPSAPTTSKYCATFRANEASDASGYFAMEVSDGTAKYSYSLNLASFGATGGCSLSSSGLKYHLHSYWINTTSTSSAGSTYCGKSLTGGHYDPYFACSSVSQSIGTSCVSLGRTSSSGYVYSCNTTAYGMGDYSVW